MILGIIPARFASSRFPGKPLVDIGGKTMIQRVYEQAKKASTLSNVIVATDDQRIFDHVQSFGGNVEMTYDTHNSGTERVLELAARSYLRDYDAYINIQGDEPFIDPSQIDLVGQRLNDNDDRKAFVATLIKRISNLEDYYNPNIIKVVRDLSGRAMYFSRSPIPYVRGDEDRAQGWLELYGFYKHIGIYGYTAQAIHEIRGMQDYHLESAELLEQLRWLENGLPIYVEETTFESHSVDVPEDLKKLPV